MEFQVIPRKCLFLHINNTMAILLKTALVWVSSIQIMQVRVQNKGKSVWKSRYDRDVSLSNLDRVLQRCEETNLVLNWEKCHFMVNPISLIILLASLVFIILSPLIQYVDDARIPQSNPIIHPSGSDVIWI